MADHHNHRLSQRIADLESQLAFQDDTIETLNQLVIQQSTELQQLQHKMQVLVDKFRQLQDNGDGNDSKPEDEIPPHY